MNSSQWLDFLNSWSKEILPADITTDPFGWSTLGPNIDPLYLGTPGCSPSALASLESRIGTQLPTSYRNFLLASDGARIPSGVINRFLSCSEVYWFADKSPSWLSDVEASEDEREANDNITTSNISLYTRRRYLRTSLLISSNEPDNEAVYLLNPQVVNAQGEWEAWFFSSWLSRPQIFPSFEVLVKVVRQQTIEESKMGESEDESIEDEDGEEREEEEKVEKMAMGARWLKEDTRRWSNPIPELSLLFA